MGHHQLSGRVHAIFLSEELMKSLVMGLKKIVKEKNLFFSLTKIRHPNINLSFKM